MKQITSFLAFIILSVSVSAQQAEPMMTQYYNSPLRINPANAGVFAGKARIITNYKRQWESFGNAFQTIQASGDFQLGTGKSGTDFFALGFDVFQDKSGLTELTNLEGNATLSYIKSLDGSKSHFVSVGFQAGYGQKSINTSNVNWGNQWTQTGWDPSIGTVDQVLDETASYFDVALGANYFYSRPDNMLKFHIGGSAFHLNQPKFSFLGNDEVFIERKFMVNSGMKWYFGTADAYSLYPNVIYAWQGPSNVLIYGLDFEYRIEGGSRSTGTRKYTSVSFGLYNRWAQTFAPVVRLNKAGFTLSFAYDFEIGNVTRVTNGMGGMEFSLMYRVGFRSGKESKNMSNAFL